MTSEPTYVPAVTTCLDNPLAFPGGAALGPERCEGEVEYRMPLSGTGKSFPRCERHWSERLDRQAEIDRRYPDSPFPPADFDPTYADERWDDDY